MSVAVSAFSGWRTALAFARREMRGGLGSFRVFLACLALGAAGVAGVGSVVAAIQASLASESRVILGGDVGIELTYRFASDAERAAFETAGDVSTIVDFRAMVRTAPRSTGADPEAALVQAKSVDGAYPLYGEMRLDPPMPLAEALAPDAEGRPGAVAEQALITRLGLQIGDPLRLGRETFTLRAAIANEPDRAAAGVGFGPRILFSTDALEASGLVTPGTLYETEYRLRVPETTGLTELREQLETQFPDAGWRWRDRRNGAPGVERVVLRIGAFLTLVGLAALAVGGVGVGASVRSYLDGKTETIAVLKTLGAESRLILRIYLIQIAALAALGIAIGVALGVALPMVFAPMLEAGLPVKAEFGFYWRPVWQAAVYSGLAAFLFALWPLFRTRRIRAASLFRDLVAPTKASLRALDLLIMAGLTAALALAAVIFTDQWRLALGFLGGVAGALVALALAATAISALARRLARSRLARGRLPLRLALSNVGGAEAGAGETRGAVLALGLGLTVLTAIGLIDVNLRRFVTDQLPERAPAYFIIDIQNADLEAFRALAQAQPGVERIESAPMLRGVISRINDKSVKEWRAEGHVQEGFGWVLNGDRGVTYSVDPPEGAEITEGEWWPKDYSGEPLVSFGDEQGRGIGLSIGDHVTVNILGRDVTARVASFRTVEFRSGGINFLMMFDPSTLKGAPHVHIATLYGEEPVAGAWLKTVAEAFPATTIVRVKDVIGRMEDVVRQIAAAARIGAIATLVTGVVVLIGAAAAGQRRQIYDAAVLKTLGATRASLLWGMTLRSALLGLAASLVALFAGSAAAWAVMRFVMEAKFAFDAGTAALVILGGVAATLITGALFALGPLSARPARVLRARE